MIHLDTHVVVWLYNREPDRFSSMALNLLDEHILKISPMVRLELQFLYEIGRFLNSADEILAYLEQRIQLSLSTADFDQVITHALNLSWTRDPFDRIIIAQSISEDVPLLTKEAKILQNYQGAVWE
jgi:PIN domain nuclease of toxin-antitoxin system